MAERDSMEEEIIVLEDSFITLGQVLKLVNLISSGGMAKWYLSEFTIRVNGEIEDRRGRKLYPGDQIEFVEDQLKVILQDQKA